MMAMMIQPMVSSMMAVATMIWPTLRRMKFISRTTIATIFTEEIDSAVPRKSDGDQPRSGCGSRLSRAGTRRARSRRVKGTTMPVTEIAIAARADLAHQPEVGLHSGQQKQHEDAELGDAVDHAALGGIAGNKSASALGQSAPSTELPTRTPASNCPIDRGLPEAVHQLAERAPHDQEHDDLGDEDRL